MVTAPYPKFVIYIHPNKGPITPVTIDLDPVMEIGAANLGSNSTDSMARAVLAQLKSDKRLESANLNASLEGIRHLTKHMNPLFSTYISGIGLRVPGSIMPENGVNPKDDIVAQLKAQLSELRMQRDTWKTKYEQEQQEHTKTTQERERLRVQIRRGDVDSIELSKLRGRIHDLEGQDQTLNDQRKLDADRLSKLQNMLTAEQEKRAVVIVERDAALSRVTAGEQDLQASQDRLGQANAQNTTLKRQKVDLEQQNQRLQQSVEQLTRALEQARRSATQTTQGDDRRHIIDY